QVPVQIRPPALSLSLSSGASLTPSRAPTTMYGGHLFQGDPVLTVALWQLATGSALAPAPAPARAAATVAEYLLPRPRASPHHPAVGRDGLVWYTHQANSYIGRL